MHRVAFNGRFSGTPQPTGTQTVAFQLFDAILREPRSFEAVVFADSRFPGISEWRTLPGVKWIEVPFQDWPRAWAQFWEQFFLPRLARQHGCRLAHHPITTCPVWQNGVKNVVTLHDLNFHRHPEWYSRSFRLVYALGAVPGLKRAARVVTISNYVRGQAAESFNLRPERLRMVYNGVKPLAAPGPAGGGNYLLCVGSLQPHKNLVRLIRAYLKIQPEFPGLELRVVGRPQARFAAESELPALLSAPGVQLLGYLSEAGLAQAYAGARVFCYPSLEEGFGLPVLEAMTLGAPVLTSNVSCLPEVAGPATLVDPYSVEAIAGGLRQLLALAPPALAALAAEGRAWAARFSWAAAARGYLKLYGELF
ncbi:MAG TPA: glycosyltransferase family 1 protein [Chthoniobacterales bacterium]